MACRYTVVDVRLVGIVGPPAESLRIAEACRAAEAGGVTAIQLRLKQSPAEELLRLTEVVLRSVAIPVYVNDRADVAVAAGADGVHLGADDLDARSVRAFVPPGFRIGVSVGTVEEATRATHTDADYWSIGSIFHTSSKPDAGAPMGTRGFGMLRALAPPKVPVIAIGGIDASNVRDILRAGAHGIAVITAIFAARDIERAARRLRQQVDKELVT